MLTRICCSTRQGELNQQSFTQYSGTVKATHISEINEYTNPHVTDSLGGFKTATTPPQLLAPTAEVVHIQGRDAGLGAVPARKSPVSICSQDVDLSLPSSQEGRLGPIRTTPLIKDGRK